MHEMVFFGRLEAWGNEVRNRRRQSLRRAVGCLATMKISNSSYYNIID